VAESRCLAVLVATFLGPEHPLVETLRGAERNGVAATRALAMIDRVPSLVRRRILESGGR
jgi:hypothetical protein